MRTALAFGGGLFTFFGALTFLSLLFAITGVLHDTPNDVFLIVVWAIVSPAVMAGAGAISFFLGTKRFGPPSATARVYLSGVGAALAMYFAFVILSPFQQLLPEPLGLLLQYALVFSVCFFASFTTRSRAG
jgi:hypothetical protein